MAANKVKAVRFTKVNGYKVVKGFDNPTLDPVATKRKADKAFKTSPEWRGIVSLLRDAAPLEGDNKELRRLAREAAPLYTKLRKDFQSYCRENPVYFDTIPNEINLPDEQASALESQFANLEPNQALTVEGDILPDYRGTTVWENRDSVWGSSKITKLGVEPKPHQTLEQDLTKEQKREIKNQFKRTALLRLSPERLDAHEELLLRQARVATNNYRRELELTLEPEEALKKSKERYTEQANKIKAEIEGIRNERERNQTANAGHDQENGPEARQAGGLACGAQ